MNKVCKENEFRCRDQHFCLHKPWVCDGDRWGKLSLKMFNISLCSRDCPDGSDEDVDMCGAMPACTPQQFRFVSIIAFSQSYICEMPKRKAVLIIILQMRQWWTVHRWLPSVLWGGWVCGPQWWKTLQWVSSDLAVKHEDLLLTHFISMKNTHTRSVF